MNSIKSKINNKIKNEEFRKYVNNSSFLNTIESFNNSTYNNKYTRTLVKNYATNQEYFKYIFGGIVKHSSKLLKNININLLRSNIVMKFIYDIFTNTDPLYQLEMRQLIYIFIYLIPKARYLIELLKGPKNTNDYYGKLLINNRAMSHPFNMNRFVNYNRLDILLSIYNKMPFTTSENFNINLQKYDITCKVKQYIVNNTYKLYGENSNSINNITNKDNLKYNKIIIKLDIPSEFFIDYNSQNYYKRLYENTYLSIKYYTYNDEVKRLIYGFKFYQETFSSLNNRTNCDTYILLDILSYFLHLLQNKSKNSEIINLYSNDDNTKQIIIIFYYLIIYFMPFHLGTASIAEMSLFTLWDTYINKDGSKKLILNPNVMIDVEALLLPYSKFYNNCFNKESPDSIYTPYFTIVGNKI
jgi:hypothetical protein